MLTVLHPGLNGDNFDIDASGRKVVSVLVVQEMLSDEEGAFVAHDREMQGVNGGAKFDHRGARLSAPEGVTRAGVSDGR